jgi:hypothetical protein
MEKHVTGIFWRACVALTALAFTAIAANAQNILFNPGFETGSTNLVYYPDNFGLIVTNQSAANWTILTGQNIATDPTNILRLAFRTSTNSPAGPTYTGSQFNVPFSGINNSGSAVTAFGGSYSLRMFGPFSNFCCTASGAYQQIYSSDVPAISNNTEWVLSGRALNWSGDPMFSVGSGAVNFGVLQIQFFDAATNFLGLAESNQLGTNMVVDVWTNISVIGDAPFGTSSIQVYALHVGFDGAGTALGSIFWDDLSLTNAGFAPPPPPIVTNQFQAVILTGNQICWGTVSNASYQPQYSDDSNTWVNVVGTNVVQQLLPGDGTTNCVFAPTHKFYRVLQQQ